MYKYAIINPSLTRTAHSRPTRQVGRADPAAAPVSLLPRCSSTSLFACKRCYSRTCHPGFLTFLSDPGTCTSSHPHRTLCSSVEKPRHPHTSSCSWICLFPCYPGKQPSDVTALCYCFLVHFSCKERRYYFHSDRIHSYRRLLYYREKKEATSDKNRTKRHVSAFFPSLFISVHVRGALPTQEVARSRVSHGLNANRESIIGLLKALDILRRLSRRLLHVVQLALQLPFGKKI